MPPNGEHQLEKKKYIFDFCEDSYRYKMFFHNYGLKCQLEVQVLVQM